jgi:flagellar protein FliL
MKGSEMAEQPEVQEAGTEEAAPKKSNKKLIIIIIAVAVLLIGGGVGAWMMMGDKPAEEGEHAEAEEHDEPAPITEPVFVKLDTFTVNLNPEEGEKYLQVDITLNATDAHDAEVLEKFMPQVRNRILMVLTSKLPSEIADMDGKKTLSAEITEQVNEPYAEGGKPLKFSEAFFTSFVIQ